MQLVGLYFVGCKPKRERDRAIHITPPCIHIKLTQSKNHINVQHRYYGVLQERLFRPDENGDRFDNTLFLFASQCFVNALFALIVTLFVGRNAHQKSLLEMTKTSPVRVPGWVWLCIVSLSYLLAMLTSNEALRYVSYPAQALAKSCKMVPVMLGSALMGVRYTWRQYVVVFAITIGVFAFQLGGGAHKVNLFSLPFFAESLFAPSLVFSPPLTLITNKKHREAQKRWSTKCLEWVCSLQV